MAEFRKLWISVALIGLFVFAMISFVVQFQQDNNQEGTILDNSLINQSYQSLQTNLTTFRTETQGQKTNFEAELPTSSFGSLIIFSIVSAGKILNGMVLGVYNVLIILPISIFGISPVVAGVISSILLVSIILLLWRLYKAGE